MTTRKEINAAHNLAVSKIWEAIKPFDMEIERISSIYASDATMEEKKQARKDLRIANDAKDAKQKEIIIEEESLRAKKALKIKALKADK